MRKRIFGFAIALTASGYASLWGGMILALFWPMIITLGFYARREIGLENKSVVVAISLGVFFGVLPSWIGQFPLIEAISLAILSAMLFPIGMGFGALSLKLFPEKGKLPV